MKWLWLLPITFVGICAWRFYKTSPRLASIDVSASAIAPANSPVVNWDSPGQLAEAPDQGADTASPNSTAIDQFIEQSYHDGTSRHRAEGMIADLLAHGNAGQTLRAIGLLQQFPELAESDGRQIGSELCRFRSDETAFELIRSKLRRLQVTGVDLSACSG